MELRKSSNPRMELESSPFLGEMFLGTTIHVMEQELSFITVTVFFLELGKAMLKIEVAMPLYIMNNSGLTHIQFL